MSTKTTGKKTSKEVMNALRKERESTVKAASARVREQRKAIRSIKEQLKEGARTVPEIASACGLSTEEVFWYLAALKKYGIILESEKDGSYYRYMLAEKPGNED